MHEDSYAKNVCQNWFCQTPFSISKITRQTGAASPKECLQKAHLQMYVLKPTGFRTFKFKYVSINSCNNSVQIWSHPCAINTWAWNKYKKEKITSKIQLESAKPQKWAMSVAKKVSVVKVPYKLSWKDPTCQRCQRQDTTPTFN